MKCKMKASCQSKIIHVSHSKETGQHKNSASHITGKGDVEPPSPAPHSAGARMSQASKLTMYKDVLAVKACHVQ